MFINLIILSYHRFVEQESDYRFSRTYEQFKHDISKKVYDQIHIDDCRICTIKACDILRTSNVRAKIFVCTELIGEPGYCTWDDLRKISMSHDMENHGSIHKLHTEASYQLQYESIRDAQEKIKKEIGKYPRYFVPPWNQFNNQTELACLKLGITLIHGRENILNISK